MKEVFLYTDGACSGNPGAGGYGAVLKYKGAVKEISAGYERTTNNRMEIMAVIAGLEALKEPCAVTLTSDSEYVIKALEQGWAEAWRANGWKRKSGPALNPDLWGRLLELTEKHTLTYVWVKGHAGHPENERCDQLAVAASQSDNLLKDEGYIG
ncbi:MAG: ribonuclease HI [Clostridia bacterium]|nr:ribonuclease HI [Clostridia bacterium]